MQGKVSSLQQYSSITTTQLDGEMRFCKPKEREEIVLLIKGDA